jgi:hypothetical protein
VNAQIIVPAHCEVTLSTRKFSDVIDPSGSFDFYCEAFGASFSIPNSEIVEVMEELNYDYIETDSVYGAPYDGKIYQVYVPKIAAGTTVRIPFRVRVPNDGDFNVYSNVWQYNTFNPENPADEVSDISVLRIEELLSIDMHYRTEGTGSHSENMFRKTAEVAYAIARKLLSDDSQKTGYKADFDENQLCDHGLLRRQFATLMLVLHEISGNYSIEQRPDGIFNYSTSSLAAVPARAVQIRKAGDFTIGDGQTVGLPVKSRIERLCEELKTQTIGFRIGIDDEEDMVYYFYLDDIHPDYLNGTVTSISYTNSLWDSEATFLKKGVSIYDYAYRSNGKDGGCGANGHGVSVRGSWDPNDITGPTGVLDARYISESGTMDYVIRFENKAEAKLPAQFVNIYDTLDRNKYDLSTFELGSIQIGGELLTVPAKLTSHYMEYDMGKYLVGITAGLNPENGAVHWRFETLDPSTHATTEDVTGGFLPPNKSAPEGEGSVSFSIKPKDRLSVNTVLSNFAGIVFDYNAPILTNVWTNTVDNAKLASSISVQQLTDSTLKVSLNASDAGSGVNYYRVYAKVNDGEFFPAGDYYGSEAEFNVKLDNVYAFSAEAGDRSAVKSVRTAAFTYRVNISAISGGRVTADRTVSAAGETVTLTLTPEQGYGLLEVSATGASLSGTGNTRTFVMPARDVTVSASFRKSQAQSDKEAVDDARAFVEGAAYAVAQTTANDEASLKAWLAGYINTLAGISETGIDAVTVSGITVTRLTEAVTGRAPLRLP